jgi:hypothetical protein
MAGAWESRLNVLLSTHDYGIGIASGKELPYATSIQ